jgi:multidrug efflux pump subunit AcrA (membrane-fusion protein)
MKMQNTFSIRIQTPLIVLVLGACLISCSGVKEETDGFAAGGAPVQVIHPRVLDFTETINLNANTVFLTKEVVRATFQGFIDKIYKTIGDEVRAGDLLFRIKTKELSTDDSLQINLGSDLFKGTVAIRAKTNGVLTALNYNVGDFVSDGEQIAVVSNPSSLCILLNVPYPVVMRIRPGTRCDLFLPNGNILQAWIHKFIPSVDPVSQTQTVLLRLSSAVPCLKI